MMRTLLPAAAWCGGSFALFATPAVNQMLEWNDFGAGITEGVQILAVNGENYGGDLLKRTITAETNRSDRIERILKLNDRYRVGHVDYHGGLRYPHLERDPAAPAPLDAVLVPRT